MFEFICDSCKTYVNSPTDICPQCQIKLIFDGTGKNITTALEPNCLIHRYQGSDLLEPARIVKEGKTNVKVAVKLKDLVKPLIIPKQEVFALNPALLTSITALRNERRETMDHYDYLIGEYWEQLDPYQMQST